MESKLFNSYADADEHTLNLLKEAWNNSGETILTTDNIAYNIPYIENINNKRYRPTMHIGQRKLFLNELQFLNKFIKFSNTYNNTSSNTFSNTSKNKFVIYAGGSPGHHMYELSRYYPNVTFIIIDPSRHQSYISDNLIVKDNKHVEYTRILYYNYDTNYIYDLKSLDTLGQLLKTEIRIFILQELCTCELLLEIKKMLPEDSDIYFLSDIRTDNAEAGKFGKDNKKLRKEIQKEYSVTDGDIIWNLVLQYNWIKVLNPVASMLKFRLPFYTDDVDNVSKYMKDFKDDFDMSPELDILNNYNNKEILYPYGKIYIQPWQGVSSTESRLVIKNKHINNLVTYNGYEYDAILNYYNLIERVVRKHNIGKQYYQYGYCECNDCGIEIDTFKKYLLSQQNKDYIVKEFNIPKYYNTSEIIGNFCLRLQYLLGTKLEGTNEHGINRYE